MTHPGRGSEEFLDSVPFNDEAVRIFAESEAGYYGLEKAGGFPVWRKRHTSSRDVDPELWDPLPAGPEWDPDTQLYAKVRCPRCRCRLLISESPSGTRRLCSTCRSKRKPGTRVFKHREPYTPWQLQGLVEHYEGECGLCEHSWEHIDHIHPCALGGSDSIWNLMPLCLKHNLEKGSKHPRQYYMRLRSSTPDDPRVLSALRTLSLVYLEAERRGLTHMQDWAPLN